jgi:FKBP-type peptidyl-prolyl cis-trans isomerase FklB
MKAGSHWRIVASAGILSAVVGAAAMTAERPAGGNGAASEVADARSDIGYSIGFDLGREAATNLKADGVDADIDALVRGFTDAVKGAKASLTDDQMSTILADVQKRVDERRTRERMASDPVFKAAAEAAAKRCKEFTEKFAGLPGVQKLDKGILYKVTIPGKGDPVGDAPAVVVNYHAYLTSGEFIANGNAVTINVAQALPGAQATLKKMRVGDRWYVVVPAELAYGGSGNPPRIGPNEAVAVDVEVLEVKK